MTKIRQGITYLILVVVSLISVFPLYWMLSSATNKNEDIVRGRALPGTEFFNNFWRLETTYHLKAAMWNSLRYAVVLTIASLLVCSLAGYGFEIYHDKKKDRVMSLLLTSMMVPFVSIKIPLFRMFSKIHMLNSTLAFAMPTISTPLMIMLFRQSARSFPYDIIEAARVDGLSEIKIFFRMFLPTMRSTYAAAMTITFMNAWNSYLWPKVIMTSEDSLTIPMLIANLKDVYVIDYGMMMVAVLLCTLPTAVVFFVLQRYFAEGITGAVK